MANYTPQQAHQEVPQQPAQESQREARTPRGRQQRTRQQPQQQEQAQEQMQSASNLQSQPLIPNQDLSPGPQASPGEQQPAPAPPTPEEANRLAGTPVETGKRGRTRKSTAPSEDASQGRREGDTAAEPPPRRRSSTRTAKASASQEQSETGAGTAPTNGKAAEQVREQPEQTQPVSEGGDGAAVEARQREEPELQPTGQPVGVQMPTSPNAGALREARIRVGNVIDRFASQIPYGEQFADEAKRAANQALDHLEAQAARRAAGLHRDLGAQPDETPGAPA